LNFAVKVIHEGKGKSTWEEGKMMIWILILSLTLTFLNCSEKALGQVYWKAKKDGSISFSDNPTSSVLKDEPEEKPGPE